MNKHSGLALVLCLSCLSAGPIRAQDEVPSGVDPTAYVRGLKQFKYDAAHPLFMLDQEIGPGNLKASAGVSHPEQSLFVTSDKGGELGFQLSPGCKNKVVAVQVWGMVESGQAGADFQAIRGPELRLICGPIAAGQSFAGRNTCFVSEPTRVVFRLQAQTRLRITRIVVEKRIS